MAYGLAPDDKNGSALLRYGKPGSDGVDILTQCQKQLFAILSPDSKLPLSEAVRLFRDNCDLAPTGPDGDRLLNLLADRLAQAQLYKRATELLAYQMKARAKDMEKGPVCCYLLAGLPGRALMT